MPTLRLNVLAAPSLRPLGLLAVACACFGLVAAEGHATTVPGSTFRVGTDMACDYATLEDALAASLANDLLSRNQDLILLSANQTYQGEYAITNQSVIIEGGYADCSSDVRGARTQITPGSIFQRVFTVTGDNGLSHHVTLDNVALDNYFTSYLGPAEGGLLYATGDDLTLRLRDASLIAGDANDGGGLYGTFGATVFAERTVFVLNVATLRGGVVFLDLGASFTATQSRFVSNRGVGAVAFAMSTTSLHLESSLLQFNTGETMIRTVDLAQVYALGLTVGNNSGTSTEWTLHENLGSGIHRIANSIVYDSDGRVAPIGASPATNVWRCLLIDDAAKDPGILHVHVGDPGWRNPGGADFRLAAGSPAIDFCDDVDAFGGPGLDGEVHGFDDPTTPNHLGATDLGAFGYTALFGDAFESGNLDAWSGFGS